MSADEEREPDEEERVFSWLDLFETRIESIERDIKELKDKINSEFTKQKRILTLTSKLNYHDRDAVTIISSLSSLNRGGINNFDNLFSALKYWLDTLDELHEIPDAQVWATREYWFFDCILFIAKKWGISFETISTYIIDKVGVVKAKEYVKRESVLKYYGTQSLAIWDTFT